MAPRRCLNATKTDQRIFNNPLRNLHNLEEKPMTTLFDLTLHLRIVGICLLLLVVLNTLMPRYFKWGADLAQLSLLTRQVFIVHALFICLILLFIGVGALVFTPLLLDRTPLASA